MFLFLSFFACFVLAGGGAAAQAHCKSLGKAPPPVVAKDVIVHPMQMAQALEKGAAATVLIACVVRQ